MDPAISQYSTNVVLTLIVGGMSYALSHAGPGEIVVSDACHPIPSGDAKIVVRVDGVKSTKNVFLPDGVPGPNQPVRFF